MALLDQSISVIKGIGPSKTTLLKRLGIHTIQDLLTYFPRSHEDRTQTSTIQAASDQSSFCICAMPVSPVRHSQVRKGLEISKLSVSDGTGQLTLCFFNQRYTANSLRTGKEYIFYGTVKVENHQKILYNPLFEAAEDPPFLTRRIVPIYRLTAGITHIMLFRLINQVLVWAEKELVDSVPEEIRLEHRLVSRSVALHDIHVPNTKDELEQARRRLIWDEFFKFSLGLGLLKHRRAAAPGYAFSPVLWEPFYQALPFSLTAAQQRVIEEMIEDCSSGRPMSRLVQGDVGSGKTMVAAASIYMAAKNGMQSALMAPTELLARQHANTLFPLFAAWGIRAGLLTGSMGASDKRAVLQGLKEGTLDLVIGTHALLSDPVSFSKLGLVITDEQHRFGVHQRVRLTQKGTAPHVLILSATPIPRTLALVLYGDLDHSILDQLPPQRQPIETFLIGEEKRSRLYGFVRKLVLQGRQVYFVCPSIEETEDSRVKRKSVKHYTGYLQRNVFPDFTIACVHGRMPAEEKEQVMESFSKGKISILVATTVIEVGVDVPNAALMVIENAERFGLSQLHQLRGRVGRGSHQSYCILLSSNPKKETLARLQALCKTRDGFQIAEADLKLRGPGDFFGFRQHGLPQWKIGAFSFDLPLLQEAQKAAMLLLEKDPALSNPEHHQLHIQVEALFSNTDGG